MNSRFESHFFWGVHSPLSTLTGAGLILMASGRFAFALLCGGALVWVYGLSALIFSGAKKIMPSRGKLVILLFLSSFLAGIYILLATLLNPLLTLGAGFFLVLVPVCCLSSGFYKSVESVNTEQVREIFLNAMREALGLAFVILAFSLIREPLGMGTLSFPGGPQGIVEIGSPDKDSFVPLRLLSSGAGGLILFGYGIALYRHFRKRNSGVHSEKI